MTSLRYITMANRLELLSHCIKKEPKVVASSWEYLDLHKLLSPEEEQFRQKWRHFLETEVKDSIIPYVEKAQFPDYLIPKLREIGIGKYFFKKPYGHGCSSLFQGVLMAEAARIDAGVSTMIVVQFGLLGATIELLGSEEQKAKYIPKIINLEMIGGWGLTQDLIGSDASNLTTTVTKVPEGYKINGTKRWAGNADRDLMVVWARNTENKKVEAYILETNGLKGWKSEPIPHKMSLRIVQNCHMHMKDVIVPESQKIAKATDFQAGTNAILKHSRTLVPWIAVGICLGVYDSAIRYTTERRQFGRPVAGFQLVQEKLVKIMANTQAVLLMCYRLSQIYDLSHGHTDIGPIAMVKAFVTERTREICRWGREVCGGNGLLHENYVMRALADIEGIYTYEGTYEINTLVAGRHLTGLSAFTK